MAATTSSLQETLEALDEQVAPSMFPWTFAQASAMALSDGEKALVKEWGAALKRKLGNQGKLNEEMLQAKVRSVIQNMIGPTADGFVSSWIMCAIDMSPTREDNDFVFMVQFAEPCMPVKKNGVCQLGLPIPMSLAVCMPGVAYYIPHFIENVVSWRLLSRYLQLTQFGVGKDLVNKLANKYYAQNMDGALQPRYPPTSQAMSFANPRKLDLTLEGNRRSFLDQTKLYWGDSTKAWDRFRIFPLADHEPKRHPENDPNDPPEPFLDQDLERAVEGVDFELKEEYPSSTWLQTSAPFAQFPSPSSSAAILLVAEPVAETGDRDHLAVHETLSSFSDADVPCDTGILPMPMTRKHRRDEDDEPLSKANFKHFISVLLMQLSAIMARVNSLSHTSVKTQELSQLVATITEITVRSQLTVARVSDPLFGKFQEDQAANMKGLLEEGVKRAKLEARLDAFALSSQEDAHAQTQAQTQAQMVSMLTERVSYLEEQLRQTSLTELLSSVCHVTKFIGELDREYQTQKQTSAALQDRITFTEKMLSVERDHRTANHRKLQTLQTQLLEMDSYCHSLKDRFDLFTNEMRLIHGMRESEFQTHVGASDMSDLIVIQEMHHLSD